MTDTVNNKPNDELLKLVEKLQKKIEKLEKKGAPSEKGEPKTVLKGTVFRSEIKNPFSIGRFLLQKGQTLTLDARLRDDERFMCKVKYGLELKLLKDVTPKQ